MPATQTDLESWKRMVLRSMPPPAWLGVDAPYSDVVLSSRARVMRNLRGFKFPHLIEPIEAEAIAEQVRWAANATGTEFESFRHISDAEREYLVACRLVSPDFEWSKPGRSVLIDRPRSLGIMINEEDHIRVQALTPGFSVEAADLAARSCVEALGRSLDFAQSPAYGWLSASPFCAGEGRRLSVMLHLIGLAQAKRLPKVLSALTQEGITARGLFGESSRAIGAFLQVSLLNGDRSEIVGAVDYLIEAERNARAELGPAEISARASQAVEFAISSSTIALADALRVIGWVRWGAAAGLDGFPSSVRSVDLLLTTLELRADSQDAKAAQHRASFLRKALEG